MDEKGSIITYRCHSTDVISSHCVLSANKSDLPSCSECEFRTEYEKPDKNEHRILGSSGHWTYIRTPQLIDDAFALCQYVPEDCAGIVGIPRSGMMVAGALSTCLNLPLYQLTVSKELQEVGSGGRMWDQKRSKGKFFAVDDSVYQGNAMNMSRDMLGDKAIYATIYCRPEKRHLVDHYVYELKSPHLFEWNLFNKAMVSGEADDELFLGGIAFDLDGVLCPDPPMPDADEGPLLDEYLFYLENAPRTHIFPQNRKIPLIITLRLEKWRSITEGGLSRVGIAYKDIRMCPLDKVSERNGDFVTPEEIIYEHKALPYEQSPCGLMVESDPRQAHIIHQVTFKPVLCPSTGEIFQSSI
jgi:hypothetical protein